MTYKTVEEIANTLIDLGVEIDTHQDGDAFIRTYTFNDAQLEALLTTALEQQAREDVERIVSVEVINGGQMDINKEHRLFGHKTHSEKPEIYKFDIPARLIISHKKQGLKDSKV